MILWLLAIASWQGYVDEARARGEARILVQLAACLPVSAESPEVQAEALRGRRLSDVERAGTLWRELDKLSLAPNEGPDTIRWPDSPERWPGERPLVPEIEKRCGALSAGSLGEELALVERAPQTPVLRYHAALLRYRLERIVSLIEQTLTREPLPAELMLGRDVLLAEQALARGEPGAGQAFLELEARLPAQRSELRMRQLQAALVAGDEMLVDAALETEVDEPFHSYFLAVRMLRLESAQNWQEILRLADEHSSTLGRDENAEIVRVVASGALVAEAFSRATVGRLEALYGRARAIREMMRVGALAIAKNRLAFARDTFTWIVAHSKALADRARAKLAVVGFSAGDAELLGSALAALGEAEPKTLETYEALLLLARAGGAGSRAVLVKAVTAVEKLRAKHRDVPRASEIVRELQGLLARGPKPLELVLSEAPASLAARPPEVRFALPEPFSLIQLPSGLEPAASASSAAR